MFPAGAGMNRPLPSSALGGPSVPRGCGDEPVDQLGESGEALCSPRVRG